MLTWFGELSSIEQVFMVFAVPSTLILVIQTILLFIGLAGGAVDDAQLDSDTTGIGGGGFDLDGDGIADTPEFETDSPDIGDSYDGGLRLFTVRGLVTFFTIFGWTGLVCVQSGIPIQGSVIIAFAAGAAGMFATAYIFKAAMKLQSNGTLNLVNAVGKSGVVYIKVPARRRARGKVNLVVQERLIEADAVTDGDSDLIPGREVVVIGMTSDNTLLITEKN